MKKKVVEVVEPALEERVCVCVSLLCVHTWVCGGKRKSLVIFMYEKVRARVCVFVCVCMYVCMYVCMCMWVCLCVRNKESESE